MRNFRKPATLTSWGHWFNPSTAHHFPSAGIAIFQHAWLGRPTSASGGRRHVPGEPYARQAHRIAIGHDGGAQMADAADAGCLPQIELGLAGGNLQTRFCIISQ